MPWRFPSRPKSSQHLAAARAHHPCGRSWASCCTRAFGQLRPSAVTNPKNRSRRLGARSLRCSAWRTPVVQQMEPCDTPKGVTIPDHPAIELGSGRHGAFCPLLECLYIEFLFVVPLTLPSLAVRALVTVVLLPLLMSSIDAEAGDQAPLIAALRQELHPSLPLDRAQFILKGHGATVTTRSAPECRKLVEESRVPTQLSPRGGPCIFGKILGPRSWYGGHTDVILQLVFGADNKLVDAHFEAIDSLF